MQAWAYAPRCNTQDESLGVQRSPAGAEGSTLALLVDVAAPPCYGKVCMVCWQRERRWGRPQPDPVWRCCAKPLR